MTSKEKQLLLKDLCARLPYGLMFQSYHNECGIEGKGTFDFKTGDDVTLDMLKHWCETDNNKPYLRPMSSMTKEEFAEYEKANDLDTVDSSETLRKNMKAKSRVRISKWYHGADWLNAHHFDYRGLIEKGLALEAPEWMYKNN